MAAMDFPSGGIVVRNTFLDLLEAPPPPPLLRAQTAPAPQRQDEDDGREQAVPPVPPVPEHPAEEYEEEDDDVGDMPVLPPPAESLYRTKTYDQYEPEQDWSFDANQFQGAPACAEGPPGGGSAGDGGQVVQASVAVAPNDMAGSPAPPMLQQPLMQQPSMMQQQQQQMMQQQQAMQQQPMPAMVIQQPMQQPGMVPVMLMPVQAPMQANPHQGWGQIPQGMPMMQGVPYMQMAPLDQQGQPQGVASPFQLAPQDPYAEHDQTSHDRADDDAVPPVPRAPVLQRDTSVASGLQRVNWTVDGRKLKMTDKEAVSPEFSIEFNRTVQFRMIVHPQQINDGRGGASFRKARGHGSVWMKCLEDVDASMNPHVVFMISVAPTCDTRQLKENERGPVVHDFSERALCGLRDGPEGDWDFSHFLNPQTNTFVISLRVAVGATAQALARRCAPGGVTQTAQP